MINQYPWLYLDYVSDIEPGVFVRAVKNFTYNEKYFPSHFPDDPSVPGFIQMECCIQAFLLTFLSIGKYKKSETENRLIDNIQVKRKIIPGDTLEINAKPKNLFDGVATGSVKSYVNGENAISFEIKTIII